MSMSRKDFIVVADSVREARYHFNACEDEFNGQCRDRPGGQKPLPLFAPVQPQVRRWSIQRKV